MDRLKIYYWFILTISFVGSLISQTYVNGNISTTTWTKAGSPYIIIADATVLSGNTLTIDPGVVVKFALGTSLNIEGVLNAVGAVNDSIVFTTNEPNPTSSQWGNIKFANANNLASTSIMKYAIVEYGNGINDNAANPVIISNSTMRFNYIGAKIFGTNGLVDSSKSYSNDIGIVIGSGAKITRSITVQNNIGIQVWSLGVNIIKKTIIENNQNGIDVSGRSTVEIDSSTIVKNTNFGIKSSRFLPTLIVKNSLIFSNGGEGIGSVYNNSLIENNTIVGNKGGGILNIKSNSAVIKNNIIYGNSGIGLQTNVVPAPTVIFNDVYNNTTNYSGFSSLYGNLVTTNKNGDPSDVYSNISLDPKFVDILSSDFHLLLTSPCIDAGDTLSTRDPDGTIADIGAYYYPQNVSIISVSPNQLVFDSTTVGNSRTLFLKIMNSGTDALTIQSVSVNSNEFIVNQYPTLIAPQKTDSFEIIFKPVSIGQKNTRLTIQNSSSNAPTLNVSIMGYAKAKVTPQKLILTYDQIDPSRFPIINNYVSVLDTSGKPIAGLNESNFTVTEDGTVENPITVTALGGMQVPISFVLTIDRSGSMSGTPLQDAKNAAIGFINQMAANDKGAVISFSSDVTVDQSFTNDKNLLINAVNSLNALGNTALFDALIQSVNQINTQSGRKAILLLTDGADNSSISTKSQAIQAAMNANVPVYTIGLGLGVGSSEELILREIADSTGGRYYYSPNSSDLQNIYSLISLQLRNQYKITYTTHNPDYNGSVRTVQITANYQGASDNKQRTYVAPSAVTVPIYPFADSDPGVGSAFWLDIKIGDANNKVSNLFGVSFILSYSSTNYISVSKPYSNKVVPGTLLGTDVVFFQSVDSANGEVAIGISRKAGSGGVSDSGSVARVGFQIAKTVPDSTQIIFTLTDVKAIDSSGNPVILTPQRLKVTVQSVVVWPGDTDNSGKVDQADVLPIGLYWHYKGLSRSNASINWVPQPVTLWNPEAATYADANGDGVVNQADILPIGFNWHKQKSSPIIVKKLAKKADQLLSTTTLSFVFDLGHYFMPFIKDSVQIRINDASNLFGLSFVMALDGIQVIKLSDLKIRSFMGSDLVKFVQVNADSDTVSVGLSRKAGQSGVDGSGIIATLYFKALQEGNVVLSFLDISAIDSLGNSLTIAGRDTSFTVVSIKDRERTSLLPTQFNLKPNYPNPFNPSTAIQYDLPKATHVKIEIYNTLGQRVRTLVNKNKTAGSYQVIWDGDNDNGEPVPSGIYFYIMNTSEFKQSRKMLLVR